jgi:hypothetical protein
MSITSTVIGQSLINGANPNTNLYQATAAPAADYWGKNATQLQRLDVPDWQDFSFSKYGGVDPTYQKFGQAAPKYKGLMDGDYTRLESSLAKPGEIAAKQAYDNARKQLSASATNRGMYGSSGYTTQMVQQADQPYMDTLAKNAATAASQRYGMQQQDLQFGQGQDMAAWNALLGENNASNQFGLNVWGQRLAENNLMNQLMANQNLAKNQYGYIAALAENGSANQGIQYGNNLLAGGYEDLWRRSQQETQEKNRLANLLFNFAQSTDQYNDAQKAQQISKMSQQGDSGVGGLLGGVGSVLGSVIPGMGSLSSLFGSSSDGVNFLGGAKPGTDWSLGPGTGVSGSTRVSANY